MVQQTKETKLSFVLLVTTLVLVIVLLNPIPAKAQARSSHNPCPEGVSDKRCYGLIGGYWEQVISPAYIVPSPYGRNVSCQARQVAYRYKNILGWTIWTFYQKTRWCFDGNVVTSVDTTSWGLLPDWDLLWRYDYVIRTENEGCVGCSYVRGYREGQFHLCFPILPLLCTNKYPWTVITVRGDGTSSTDSGVEQ